MKQSNEPTALDEQAASWALRLDAGTLTAAEEKELDDWTQADARHAGALARAMAANAYLDRIAALRPQSIGEEDTASIIAPSMGFRPSLINRRAWIGGGIGAVAATVMAAIGISRWSAGERISTPKGSLRREALADGSAVTLNSNAEISVVLEQSVRRVHLIAGEVNFDVAKDRARPFLIDAGDVRVRVVGTSFLVRRDENDVAVTVREGVVEVRRSGGAPVRLGAGDRLLIGAGAGSRREALSMADVDRLGLWQRGEVDLTGMTLRDAATEFSRYSDQRIIINDDEVARLKVAGIFSTSDPVGFARSAALAQGLKAQATPGGILLTR
ncbi:FecR domain-containing protein [Sphingomonas sp. GM_Shp_2]|uniref:FecR family protein n=1 Tax=Sphingomonas sp. GM_Shp_2 TaxID=2937380 RepID=UPI002269939F|nr:FecR domain-containing protein [Sphingomonas sp. GM_Shp_2]